MALSVAPVTVNVSGGRVGLDPACASGQEPEDECAEVTAGTPDGPVECAYCEINDSGTCEYLCANGSKGEFPCSEFDDDNEN